MSGSRPFISDFFKLSQKASHSLKESDASFKDVRCLFGGLKGNNMKVYILLVDSAKRQPGGHEYDFEWDLSGLSTARDLKDHTWMATVEWTDPIRYSEMSPILEKMPHIHPPSS